MGVVLVMVTIAVLATGYQIKAQPQRWRRTSVDVIERFVSRGVCEACDWAGPFRDTSRDRERVFLGIDRDRHEIECKGESDED